MLISIVLTSYNGAPYVGQAVESALAQSHPETEVIVVDDGSTDDSREVLARYADRVQVILKPNGGQGSAINTGFAASRGELVLFLDCDDLLFPVTAETVAARWNPGISMMSFRLQKMNALGPMNEFIPARSERMPEGLLWPGIVEAARYPYPLPPTSGNIFSREFLLGCLPMPEETYRLDSDAYMKNKAFFAGEILTFEEVLGYYRVHASNNSHGMYRSLDKIRDRLKRDLANFQLLHEGAGRYGKSLRLPPERNYFDHLRLRLMSLCEDAGNHPVATDRRAQLWWWSICALGEHRRSWPKKILQGLHVTGLALAPASLIVEMNRLWSRLKARIS